MPDYEKFKNVVADLVMGEVDANGNVTSSLFSTIYLDGKTLVLDNADIEKFFNLSSGMNFDGVEMLSGVRYEIGCFVEKSEVFFYKNFPIVIKDAINNVSYEIGVPSREYASFIISKMSDKSVETRRTNSPSIMLLMDYISHLGKRKKIITTKDLLPRMIGLFSITIKSKKRIDIDVFRRYKNAIEFHFMYKNNIPIISIGKIEDLYEGEKDFTHFRYENISEPPLRIYDSNVIEYYKVAFSSDDPYIKYISFYHVIEYYYDEVFRKNIIDAIRDKITSPSFSYKNDDNIFEIATFVKRRIRYNDESGQGNEKDSLEYVLEEYVSIKELQKRIEEIKKGMINYYKSNTVSFCNGSIIHWSNMQGVYSNLARRIYETRNALIHSKSGKSNARYRPSEHESLLIKELPLIRAVAELVIINSSEII